MNLKFSCRSRSSFDVLDMLDALVYMHTLSLQEQAFLRRSIELHTRLGNKIHFEAAKPIAAKDVPERYNAVKRTKLRRPVQREVKRRGLRMTALRFIARGVNRRAKS